MTRRNAALHCYVTTHYLQKVSQSRYKKPLYSVSESVDHLSGWRFTICHRACYLGVTSDIRVKGLIWGHSKILIVETANIFSKSEKGCWKDTILTQKRSQPGFELRIISLCRDSVNHHTAVLPHSWRLTKVQKVMANFKLNGLLEVAEPVNNWPVQHNLEPCLQAACWRAASWVSPALQWYKLPCQPQWTEFRFCHKTENTQACKCLSEDDEILAVLVAENPASFFFWDSALNP